MAIMGYGELLKAAVEKDSPARYYAEQILSSAAKSAKLTQQILAFSRKQIISPKLTDLNELIRGVEQLLGRLLGEDIAIHMTLADRNLIVFVDHGQLEQVLMNLCTNARDAMPRGGELFIGTGAEYLGSDYKRSHELEDPGMYALLTVTDTGSGMDEETRQRIFEPFYTTKEIGKGTGLGLATAYGIIKQHHGHINVYSEPGKGTTFKIYLPLIASGLEEEVRKEVVAPKRGSETILIAEDDELVRKLMMEVLLYFGYEVIEAVDGQDAVNKFMRHKDKVRLVILDVIMAKKNGKEAGDEIRKMEPAVKVLYTSGYTADIIHAKGILEEGVDFLSKPLTPHDLLSRIREILDK
jgi:CheY-like chemotaxis protein